MREQHLGTYSDAVALARLTGTTPDTANVRQYASRPGAAINWEQEITPTVGVFARASINNGAYEAFEFTDVNQSVMAGVSIKGNSWSRGQDTVCCRSSTGFCGRSTVFRQRRHGDSDR